MKRIMAAMFAAILTFGLVYGLAASLNLTTDSLGAATNTVAACQAGTMNATVLEQLLDVAAGLFRRDRHRHGSGLDLLQQAAARSPSPAASASLGEATGDPVERHELLGDVFASRLGGIDHGGERRHQRLGRAQAAGGAGADAAMRWVRSGMAAVGVGMLVAASVGLAALTLVLDWLARGGNRRDRPLHQRRTDGFLWNLSDPTSRPSRSARSRPLAAGRRSLSP